MQIPTLNVAEYHRPYVAIWVEHEDQSIAANLAVWYQTDPKKEDGTQWLKDLRQWWRRGGREQKLPIDGVTGATRPVGEHALQFNGTGKQLSALATGKYSLVVEAVREVGGRELLRVPFDWPAKNQQQPPHRARPNSAPSRSTLPLTCARPTYAARNHRKTHALIEDPNMNRLIRLATLALACVPLAGARPQGVAAAVGHCLNRRSMGHGRRGRLERSVLFQSCAAAYRCTRRSSHRTAVEVKPENVATGKYRTTFDLHLTQNGTYRLANINSGLFANYEENGAAEALARHGREIRHRSAGECEKLAGIRIGRSRRDVRHRRQADDQMR